MNKLPHSPSSDSVRNGLSLRSSSTDEKRMSTPSGLASLDSPMPSISSIPSSMANWEASPQSPSNEKQRPFKSKSKHNLAMFGAKLTSTAASVGAHASKYKQHKDKDTLKDSNRESVFVDVPETLPHQHDATSTIMNSPSMSGTGTPNSGGSNGGSMLKSKMFKQSKSDLKSLRIKTDLGIQAARSSLNDRSPMVRGGSTKELDRIAAIGQIGSPVQVNEMGHGSNSHLHIHHLHHPHISFRKRDSPAAVLSSSASNSKLASEGTVYSFNQSNSNGAQLAVASSHSFKTIEEGIAFLTTTWSLLTERIQSVFIRGQPLRIPVEDVNILVLMHFSTHYALSGTGLEILTRLDEFLQNGFKSSTIIPQNSTLESLAESWQYFHSRTLIYLEAIFLPLQLELDAIGQIFSTPQAARDYWYPVTGSRPVSLNRFVTSGRGSTPKINIRRRVLAVYRDVAVIPRLPKIMKHLEDSESSSMSPETVSLILRCFTTLAHLQTDDQSQKDIEAALATASEGLQKRYRHAANGRRA